MSQHLSPYINFQGRAREAMEFYHRVLGGELELQAIGGQGAPRAAAPGDRIMHARLEAEGARIIASDGHPDSPPTVGDHMAIALQGTDRERLARVFEGLAAGGTVSMPFGDMGWLVDQFGIHWVVSIDAA